MHFFVEMTKKSVGPSNLQPDLRHQPISNAVNPPPILLTSYYIICYLSIRHFNPSRFRPCHSTYPLPTATSPHHHPITTPPLRTIPAERGSA